MKRLLAYLFIVLGLGLTFSVNANSAKYSYDKDFICFQDVGNGTIFVGTSKSGWVTQTDNIEYLCSIFVYADKHPKKYKEILNKWPYLNSAKLGNKKVPFAEQYIKRWKLKDKKFSKLRHKKSLLKQTTQIAKTDNKNNTFIKKVYKDGRIYVGEWMYGSPNGKGIMTYPRGVKYIGQFKSGSRKGYGYYLYKSDKRADVVKTVSGKIIKRKTIYSNDKKYPKFAKEEFINEDELKKIISNDSYETQIAKAEPSQTQNLNDFQRGLKAAENEDYSKAEDLFRKFIIENPKDKKLGEVEYWLAETFRVRKLFTDAASAYLEHYQKYPMDSYGPQNLMKLGMMMIEIGEKKQGCKMIWGVPIQYPTVSIDILNRSKFEAYYYDCPGAKKVKKISLDKNIDIELLSEKNNKTQIAKAEPTITPKKKVKVTKKEPKQEEFKPKKTNQDNEAPVIEIAEAITVDSQAYTLKGKVKDKSQVYLTIDGRQVDIKKGKFEFPGFVIDPSEGEVLKIVATDRWQNKSEKTINIKVEFKQTADARSYEKPNPNNIRTKTDNDKIGIIIGIEKYQALSNLDAPYANRDANAFRAYATRALGIPNKNLKVLIDNEANRSGLLKALKIWLPQMTRGKSKDIYIFFAGHGLASDDGKDLHILPQDGDPILLEETALSRVQMFDLINKVSPKSVTMFFDTCYSGQTRDERMLVAGLRPVRIVADEQDTPNNFTIFTASNYDQTSGSINEAEHGIFSYYLMKGLEGKADENKDRKITNGELISYLKDNVSQEAFTQNRQQDPMLAGDPDKILIKF